MKLENMIASRAIGRKPLRVRVPPPVPTKGASAAWNVVPRKFVYEPEHKGLLFRHWQNVSDDQGRNNGDIASR